jgi:hypothetical protein
MLNFYRILKLNIEYRPLLTQLVIFEALCDLHCHRRYMTTIIASIRQAATELEVSSLLDTCWQENKRKGNDQGLFFLSELRAALNQIDPIDVAEPAEWANIQHARVHLHRITAKRSS